MADLVSPAQPGRAIARRAFCYFLIGADEKILSAMARPAAIR
jgi:hypothetical protein